MSKLTELLNELCPGGVEYRPLGEVAEYVRDRRDSAELDPVDFVGVDNLMPDFQGVGAPTYGPNTAKVTAFVDGDILIGNIRPYLKKIWLANREGGCSGDVLALRVSEAFEHSLEPYFLYRVLASEGFFNFNMQHARGGKMPRGDKQMILRYPTPVPPLKVQREIVRVLDAFTDLEQSLVSKLELRKKQLAVLHEGLLEEVADQSELLSLESVCIQILAGGDKPKDCVKSQTSPTEERPFPVFSNGTGRDSLYGYSSECRVNAEAVTIAARGSVGHHAVRAAGFTPIIRLITLIPNSEVISAKYLNCALDTLSIDGTSGGISQLTVPMVKKLSIPVPSLEVQQEIVRVLDAFTDLEQSLVSELELRKKQFAEYRKLAFLDSEDAELRTLGDISVSVTSGATPKAGNDAYYNGGEIPWLRTAEINFGEIWDTEVKITDKALKETAVKWIPKDCLVVAISGATAGRSAINKIRTTTNQHCCCLDLDPDVVDVRYAFHWTAANYLELKSLGRGARGDLNSRIIRGFEIPIPTLDVQKKVVAKLDTFSNLIQSIEREISLRRTQYEFYRDELLSFVPKED